MVVRNVVRSPVRAVVQSVFGEGESFHPFQLFTSGAQGAWYDPSDFSTLYQDAAGTTPVTAVEQPVRLMLDRSRGLVLGSELVTNGDFSDGTTGWTANTATLSVSSGALLITNTGTNGSAYQDLTTVAGRSYKLQFTCVAENTAQAQVFVRDGSFSGTIIVSNLTLIPGTTYDLIFVAASTTTTVRFLASGTTTDSIAVDNISVRELPGNHAVAPNDASRPILRARYNLLTRTEEFDDAAWSPNAASVTANAAVAPDGTTTAHLLTADGTSTTHFIRPATGSWANGGTFTETVYIKRNTANFAHLLLEGHNAYLQFSLTDGSVTFTSAGTATNTAFSVTDAGNGWYRARLTATNTTGSTMRVRYYVLNASSNTASPSETTTASMYLWGASLLTAADHAATGGAYQRVGAATDYDTGPPWRPYLAFDGSDDRLFTGNVDFSTTDKVTVWAGVGKLSDAARGMILAVPNTGFNRFAIEGPTAAAGNNYRFSYAGDTTVRTAVVSKSAPSNDVLSMTSDLGAPLLQGRLNGVAQAPETGTTGGGNFQNTSINIGADNVPQFFFNGRLYSLAVLGRTATSAELTSMESWIAGKTGVSL